MKPSETLHLPRVIFVGMPGAGKTRIGREVAGKLQIPFKDTDVEIERLEGMTIPEIFDHHGEDAFRRIETQVCVNCIKGFDGVISLGGGAILSSSTAHALQEYAENGGTIVYLQADVDETIARLEAAAPNRPLLADGDVRRRWQQLYDERHEYYEALSTIAIANQSCTATEAAERVLDEVLHRKVHVGGLDPYDVEIGDNLFVRLPHIFGDKVHKIAVIHTEPVRVHACRVVALLQEHGYMVYPYCIPDAEFGKTIDVANDIWTQLGEQGFTRSDAIVGLGGGACTDVAGFIAATWMRGITYVNCPTSLLAMVDASTGGKTGINTPQGKNLVGSFYTPKAVLADFSTLTTLPNDIFVEGLGEVVKSGFIADPHILKIVESHARQLREFNADTISPAFHSVIADIVGRTVRVKSDHVTADLKESGLREFLNYGHTLGHAIEALEHFQWRHGQAVAVGMVFAAQLSANVGLLSQDIVDYHRSILSSVGLKTTWDGASFDEVLTLMHRDKKARGSMLRFVVLDRVGHARILENPPLDAVRNAFETIRS